MIKVAIILLDPLRWFVPPLKGHQERDLFIVEAFFYCAGGDTAHDRIRINIFGDNSASSNDSAITDGDAGEERCTGSDPNIVTDYNICVVFCVRISEFRKCGHGCLPKVQPHAVICTVKSRVCCAERVGRVEAVYGENSVCNGAEPADGRGKPGVVSDI